MLTLEDLNEQNKKLMQRIETLSYRLMAFKCREIPYPEAWETDRAILMAHWGENMEKLEILMMTKRLCEEKFSKYSDEELDMLEDPTPETYHYSWKGAPTKKAVQMLKK